MKKLNNILWGLVLVAVGVLLALNAFGITDLELFFDGWWTLFLIVPCTIGLFSQREKTGNLIGLLIGVFLLLCCQDVLEFDMLWKLVLPVIIIIIGAKMIFGSIFGNKSAEVMNNIKQSGGVVKNATATFSSVNMNCNGEVFTGAELTAVFGGVKCDLRGAIIDRDCVINACGIFGGIDIFLPENVNVKINSNSLFGGVSDKKGRNSQNNRVTVYVNGTCIFGGVDVR